MNNKILYNFNIALVAVGFLTIISGLSLKIFYGKTILPISFDTLIWIHIIISAICMIAIFYHLYIHWKGVLNWIKRIKSINAKINIALIYATVLTILSGIIAFVSFILGCEHNFTGSIHGKIGFAFIILMVIHTLKRLKWFRNRKKGKPFVPVVDENKCIKCKRCVNKCPADVFTFESKKVVVKYDIFCIQCKKCVDACPKRAIH